MYGERTRRAIGEAEPFAVAVSGEKYLVFLLGVDHMRKGHIKRNDRGAVGQPT